MQFGWLNCREFITLLGGVATWPIAARAQHAAPVIGMLLSRSRASSDRTLRAFHRGLAESGYVEARNVAQGSRPCRQVHGPGQPIGYDVLSSLRLSLPNNE